MEWYIILLIIFIGFLVGFINTITGSGSLLSLPLLIFLGLDANTANGTNRIAILMQTTTAVGSYYHQQLFSWKDGLYQAIPAMFGGIAGALIAVKINAEIFEIVVGVLLIVMFFLLLLKPEKWLKEHSDNLSDKSPFWQIVIYFFIGIYGSFIQAGVGLFLLAALVLSSGYPLVKANIIKVYITLLFTVIALLIFILNNQVNYTIGLIMGIGNMGGAWIAAKFTVKWGPNFIRWFMLLTLVVSALKLFGLF